MKTPDLQGLRTRVAEWAAESKLDPSAVERLEEVGKLAAADGLEAHKYSSRIFHALDEGQPAEHRVDLDDMHMAEEFVARFASQFRAMSDLFVTAANGAAERHIGNHNGWAPSRVLANLFGGFFPRDVPPERVAALTEADAAERYNDVLDLLPLGPHQNAELASMITTGAPAPAVFVSTHILPPLQPALAATLADARFARMPRLFLIDGAEPLTSTDLIAQASVLRKSNYGELDDVQFNCSKFHLAGGYADACLSNTTRQLIERHARSANAATPLELNFHAEHVFDSGGVTLAGQIRAANPTPRGYVLSVQHFMKVRLPPGYTLGAVTPVEQGDWVTLRAAFASADGGHRGEMCVTARTAAAVLSAT